MKEVEPHNEDNNMLNRGDNIMNNEEIMLTPILFLVLEVEEEERWSHHVLHMCKEWT